MTILGGEIKILKGRMAPQVFEKPQGKAQRYLQIDDLRPNATAKYAIDPRGVMALDTDVLIAWDGANAGTVGWNLSGYAGSTIAVLRPVGSNIYGPYLGYYLQHKFEYLQRNTTGATIPHISRQALESLRITLHPLPEQQRIAGILSRADRLRRLRRYALEMSDTYPQSVFLEMFGDPVANSKKWHTKELRHIATINRGRFSPRPRSDPKFYGGVYPFIQTGDISKSNGFLRHYSQTLNSKGIKVSRAFDVGTIVIAIVGATIGETAILGIRTYCPDSVIGIRVNPEEATPEFIEHQLRFWKPIFRMQAPETARANINLETLRPLAVPVPPLSKQQVFSEIVYRHERQFAQQREALRQAEHLFQTLLHRAFRGEV